MPASMKVGPFTIHDSHPHPAESMTIGDIIAESSNIGAAMVAEQVGNVTLASFMEKFGFGQPTGSRVPGRGVGRAAARRKLGRGDPRDGLLRRRASR